MPEDFKVKTITDMLNSGFEAAKKENMQEILETYKNTFTECTQFISYENHYFHSQ